MYVLDDQQVILSSVLSPVFEESPEARWDNVKGMPQTVMIKCLSGSSSEKYWHSSPGYLRYRPL